ncbi:hypothetical protein P1X14_08750 [Sphingomonas sp. AOB5]|uniref:hypothetical protein n=1 Tax=Sphingomonas sp. AOB5 TaxID=3034017 RepID=UPI0023F8DC16|nr:hypothetical protein [Sphingomonas sp. AOB5]MDF7775333.1 hypothetical protein [Sphingomonas sp. AOB5]
MSDDPFETVVIAYSQSQAGVILSLFEWNGIPAYAMNFETVRTNPALTLALGGIPIRVAREAAADAREILNEAAEAGAQEQSLYAPLSERVANVGLLGMLVLLGSGPPPPRLSAEIIEGA